MELYSYFVTDVVFGDGPLYFSVKKSDYDHPVVKGFKKTDEGMAPAIQRIEAINVDDYIIEMNGKSTAQMSFSEFKSEIASASRPLTLRFAKPAPKNEWKRIVIDEEKPYMKQWSTIDIHLPIRKYDLSSHDPKNLTSFEEFKETKKVFTPLTETGSLFECDIRQHCFDTSSKDIETRATYWKLLLHYYPWNPSSWEKHTQDKINEYNEFVNEFILKKNKEINHENCRNVPSPLDITWKEQDKENVKEDENESPWSKAFGDTELRDIIWKDTLRTYSDHPFFTEEARCVFSRILFIFAKLNTGIKYVQGMNELLAPLIMVFSEANVSKGGNPLDECVEVDSFYCFNTLMSETRDLFIRQLDSDNSGINGVFKLLEHYINVHVPEVSAVLEEQSLQTQYYALRWMTTLYAREFDLKHTYRLWDCLLADPARFQFMYCFGAAMIRMKEDTIIANSFSENMKLLQNYECDNFKKLLKTANKIRVEELRLNSGFYEESTDLNAILDKTKDYLLKGKDKVGEQMKKGWMSFKTIGLPKLNDFAKSTMSKATEISKEVGEKSKVFGKEFSEKSKVFGKEVGEKSKVFGEKSKEISKKFLDNIREKADAQMKPSSKNDRKNSAAANIDENAVTDTSEEEDSLSLTEDDNGVETI